MQKKKKVSMENLAAMTQRGFQELKEGIKEFRENVGDHFERIEKLILTDHKHRIERLEFEVRELKDLFAMK